MKGVRRLRGSLLNPVVGGGYELGGVSAGWEERAGDGIAPGDWCGDRLGAGRGGRQRGLPWAGGGVWGGWRGDTPAGAEGFLCGGGCCGCSGLRGTDREDGGGAGVDQYFGEQCGDYSAGSGGGILGGGLGRGNRREPHGGVPAFAACGAGGGGAGAAWGGRGCWVWSFCSRGEFGSVGCGGRGGERGS